MYGKLFDELPVAQDGFDLKPTCFKILNEIELVFHVVIIKFFMIAPYFFRFLHFSDQNPPVYPGHSFDDWHWHQNQCQRFF